MDTNSTDLAGVAFIQHFFANNLGWIMRIRQPIDIGIDADVEQMKDGAYTGKHIALQIKSGESYLKTKNNGMITFLIDDWHYKYWLSSDRPVLILFYDTANQQIIWEQVKSSKISKTTKQHKIEITPQKILTTDSLADLEDIITIFTPTETEDGKIEKTSFEFSLSCMEECVIGAKNINEDFANFLIQIGKQLKNLESKAPHRSIAPYNHVFCGIFDNFRKRLSSETNIFIPNYYDACQYLSDISDKIYYKEKDQIADIINKNICFLNETIKIWDSNILDIKKIDNPPVDHSVRRAASNCITIIEDYCFSLKSALDFIQAINDKICNITKA